MKSHFSGLTRNIYLIYLLWKPKVPKSAFSYKVYFVKLSSNRKNVNLAKAQLSQRHIVMQIGKALINDRLYVLKVSWKFRIPTIYNFAVIYPWNWLFSQKVAYFLTVSIVFSVYKQTLRPNNLKTRTAITQNFQCLLFVLKRS